MLDAPPVSYPVGRSFWGGWILLVLTGAAGVACAAWVLHGASGTRAWAAGTAVLPAAWAAWHWWRQPRGTLAWDGGAWSWSSGADEQPGLFGPFLDLQQAMLLPWRGPAGTRWLWVERRHAPNRWAAFRRAVYSRAGSAAPPGAEPPSAAP
jgi:hypothetical protein